MYIPFILLQKSNDFANEKKGTFPYERNAKKKKIKRIVRKPNFSDQFKKIIKCYIKGGYNLEVMRQSACLDLNPITVYSYGFFFNCTMVGQASDSMTALT